MAVVACVQADAALDFQALYDASYRVVVPIMTDQKGDIHESNIDENKKKLVVTVD